jgi:FAD/FMN-containing dehydrogenase
VLVEDASGFRGEADEIVTPESEAGVIAFLERTSKAAIPVTVAGAGTGVTGGRVPQRGVLLSLQKLNRLEIHQGYAVAGAGVLLSDLHSAAAPPKRPPRSGAQSPPTPAARAAFVTETPGDTYSGCAWS